MQKILIVGASLAGTRALQALRSRGYAGAIVFAGDELEQPYDRPPLSKQLLGGEWGRDDVALLTSAELDDLDVDLRLGIQAHALDVAARKVTFRDGTALSYDGLVIATGARPRHLPGAWEGERVHVVRSLADSQKLAKALRPGVRLGVLGGGFLGSEVASAALKAGVEVTVLERDALPMTTTLGKIVGAELALLQQGHGIDLVTGATVSEVTAHPDEVTVRLVDGATRTFDHVLMSIGAVPNCEWLAGSGLRLDHGLVVGPDLFAADHVVAAGDVVRIRDQAGHVGRRVEHWTNAAAQGEAAAASLLAGPAAAKRFSAVPYVWSDQFGSRIEILGEPSGTDQVEKIWASRDGGQCLFVYRRGANVTALVGFNAVRWLVGVRRKLRDAAALDDQVLAELEAALPASSR